MNEAMKVDHGESMGGPAFMRMVQIHGQRAAIATITTTVTDSLGTTYVYLGDGVYREVKAPSVKLPPPTLWQRVWTMLNMDVRDVWKRAVRWINAQ